MTAPATDADTLTDELGDLDVSNVYVYVGDAVRYDYIPDSLAELGRTVKTVAASTHSPTSFASLSTGNHPPGHGVETFTDRVHSDVPNIFDLFKGNSGFVNSIFEFATPEHGQGRDPIFSVLDRDPSTQVDLADAKTPFLVMERGPGGHAPYGDFDGSASDYFRQRGSAPAARYRSDYERSIELDVQFFRERYEMLRERDLQEDTLVIYTSDHGELLGEYGLLGHNAPMCPELAYVPSCIIHPNISAGHVNDANIHHVDITSTIGDMLNIEEDALEKMDGNSMLHGLEDAPRPTFWSNSFLPSVGPLLTGTLEYQGAWDSDGGYTKTSSHIGDRLAIYIGKLAKSSKRRFMLRHLAASFASYCRSDRQFADPGFSKETAKSTIEAATTNPVESVEASLSEEGREHLSDLGYME